jgi:signal transduction histidine kinase
MSDPKLSDADETRRLLHAAERKNRCVSNAIEQVLSIGDFQGQVNQPMDVQAFIQLTAQRINSLIAFDISAIYFVDQSTSGLDIACCLPTDHQKELENQFELLIHGGYIAWALREPRGIMVYSADRRYRVLLHVMATYSRIRGLFIGLLDVQSDRRLPDESRPALSLILRNATNALESIEYLALFKRHNAELETKVDQKVEELRRRDMQLLNARRMDAIATLAGGVAHQYNNALAVLVGGLDLIKLQISRGQNTDNNLSRLESVALRMQDLTAKLLAYARGGKYLTEKVFIDKLVETALRGALESSENPVDIELTMRDETYCVNVDVTQMQLALSAIVTNAVEALETGGRIAVSAEKICIPEGTHYSRLELVKGDYVLLKIKDNGKGMDEHTREHIFDPFFSTKFTGRGLNMAAAYGIVKNHHGEIAVQSQVGQGTTVKVYLPLADRIDCQR